MNGKEVFETYELEVRSYCRSFPAIFPVAAPAAAAAAADQKDQDNNPPAVAEPIVIATHISYLLTDICAAVCRADSSYSVGAIW